MLISLFSSLWFVYLNTSDLTELQIQRFESNKLADELRQSSDDLTRMARTYVITGDIRYKEYFDTIQAIRDGDKPRPQDYQTIYWDFVTADHKYPDTNGRLISIVDLMKELNFDENEHGILAEAKLRSDKLINMEIEAFEAVKKAELAKTKSENGEYLTHLSLARQILHSPEYHLEKAKIMEKVGEFFKALDGRTLSEVEQKRKSQTQGLVVAILLVMLLVVYVIGGYFYFKQGIIKPLIQITTWVGLIQKGQYHFKNTVTSDDELGLLSKGFISMSEIIDQQIQELERINERITIATHSTEMGIWDYDIINDKLVWDAIMFQLYGISSTEFKGNYQAWKQRVHPDDLAVMMSKVKQSIELCDNFDAEFRIILPDGKEKYIKAQAKVTKNRHGTVCRMVGINYDITHQKLTEMKLQAAKNQTEKSLDEIIEANLVLQEEVAKRNRIEGKLNHMAMYDGLTNLPNRAFLKEAAEKEIAVAKRKNHKVGVIFIDLDNFKPINDNFGHDIGDLVLVEFSIRIKDAIRECDTLARLGGDEFLVLLPDCGSIGHVIEVAERILVSANQPLESINNEPLSLSQGISLYPDDADNFNGLTGIADQAMYRAKKSGKNQIKANLLS